MRKSPRTNCSKCGSKVRKFKLLKKINGDFLCKKCVIEKRKLHREFLKRKVMGIRKKTDIMKECKERREREKELRKIVSSKPAIKPIKKVGRKISGLGLYITKIEKQVLWGKLLKKGLTQQEANERIKQLCNKMVKIREKLKMKVKTTEELNKRFKEEFARLCEDLE